MKLEIFRYLISLESNSKVQRRWCALVLLFFCLFATTAEKMVSRHNKVFSIVCIVLEVVLLLFFCLPGSLNSLNADAAALSLLMSCLPKIWLWKNPLSKEVTIQFLHTHPVIDETSEMPAAMQKWFLSVPVVPRDVTFIPVKEHSSLLVLQSWHPIA